MLASTVSCEHATHLSVNQSINQSVNQSVNLSMLCWLSFYLFFYCKKTRVSCFKEKKDHRVAVAVEKVVYDLKTREVPGA